MLNRQLTSSEEAWLKNFNYAFSTGDRKALEKICPDRDKFKVIVKELDSQGHRRRRDLMPKNVDSSFIADRDYEVSQRAPAPLLGEFFRKNSSTYVIEDYGMVAGYNTIEDALIEFLDARQGTKRVNLSSVKHLIIGTKVKVWMEDHIFDKEIGVVTGVRDDGTVLVEILSRKSFKKNSHDESRTVSMYCSANELRLFP